MTTSEEDVIDGVVRARRGPAWAAAFAASMAGLTACPNASGMENDGRAGEGADKGRDRGAYGPWFTLGRRSYGRRGLRACPIGAHGEQFVACHDVVPVLLLAAVFPLHKTHSPSTSSRKLRRPESSNFAQLHAGYVET